MLPAKLVPGMLVLADRNFYGFRLWRIACASGARLAWRVKANLKLAVEQVVQRMFEGSGKKLPVQINRNKSRAGVDVFVACHLSLRKFVLRFDLDI